MIDELKTKSMWLAAALIARGAELIHTDKTDPKHMEFHLVQKPLEFQSEILKSAVGATGIVTSSPPSLAECENQWANDKLEVIAPRYAEAIQRLKSIIHSI